MTSPRLFLSSWFVALAAAGVTLPSVTAHAGTSCSKDSDCTKGLTCQSDGPVACPAIACAPGQDCPLPPGCGGTPPAMECAPGPCNTDSDCGDGLVCFARTETECPVASTPACPPDEKCVTPAVDAGACTTTTTKSCVPRYVLPCNADSDCGAGFSCVADQQCECSGSAGSGGSGTAVPPTGSNITTTVGTVDAGAPTPPGEDGGTPPPSCGCTALTTSHCEAKVVDCNVAGDCPSQWACVSPPTAVSGCAVAVSVDGGPSPEPCTPIDSGPVPSVCQPPYQDLGVSAGFGAGESKDSSLGVAAPTAAGASNAGKDNATTATGAAVVGDGGCQVGHGPVDASDGVWFGLFGLGLFARRRRSQARS